MKVLFVSSGNSINGISPIVKNQAQSLTKHNNQIIIDFFPVKGRGIKNYFRNALKLSEYLSQNKYDIIHAHYTLSGYVTSLSRPKIPVVVSVMGGDAYMGFPYSLINQLLIKTTWNHVVIKSPHLKKMLKLNKNYSVIPNGVDLDRFVQIEKEKAKEQLGLEQEKKYVLFASDPARKEKNFELAEKAFNQIKNDKLELLVVHGKSNDTMPLYYNASDVLLFTSHREGSPNVIKEAMSCNLPIVSTDVGDIAWVLGSTEGCYISSFEVSDVMEKLKKALQFTAANNKTAGRKRIKNLNLDSKSVAETIINIYRGLVA